MNDDLWNEKFSNVNKEILEMQGGYGLLTKKIDELILKVDRIEHVINVPKPIANILKYLLIGICIIVSATVGRYLQESDQINKMQNEAQNIYQNKIQTLELELLKLKYEKNDKKSK